MAAAEEAPESRDDVVDLTPTAERKIVDARAGRASRAAPRRAAVVAAAAAAAAAGAPRVVVEAIDARLRGWSRDNGGGVGAATVATAPFLTRCFELPEKTSVGVFLARVDTFLASIFTDVKKPNPALSAVDQVWGSEASGFRLARHQARKSAMRHDWHMRVCCRGPRPDTCVDRTRRPRLRRGRPAIGTAVSLL